jgi:hypothetical protein
MGLRRSTKTCWYQQFWAQTWYRNTYLVRHPRQIGRAIADERDWNNIYDSGCNFVCMAMIMGIDPARLATELMVTDFFRPDRECLARRIDGSRGGLVWDQNVPQAGTGPIRLGRIWEPRLGRRISLELEFAGEDITFDHAAGKRIVRDARRRGEHIVAGARDHSHLVAGRIGADFYLWDPDDTSVAIEYSLAGRLTLAELFAHYDGREPIEFWRYRMRRKVHAPRAPPKNWRYER